MTSALFLAPLGSPVVGERILVDGDEGRHAVVVKRVRPGERVYVADGQGNAIHGEVLSADKAGLIVRVDEVFLDRHPVPHVVAVQALAKGGRDEQAIEAMTELGVAEVVPWRANRSIVKWDDGPRGDKQRERWRATVREAAKQSRRFHVPLVGRPVTTAQLCADLVATERLVFVLHEDATERLAAQNIPGEGRIVIVIGPEGGIAPEELDQLVAAGAIPVTIAEHVLRSSTAGVVALAQLQLLAGRAARG